MQVSQVLANRYGQWMVGAESFFVDGKGAAVERFSVVEIAFGLQERCQIIEPDGHVGMVGAESFFVDGEGAAESGSAARDRLWLARAMPDC